MSADTETLIPCPFCGSGETVIEDRVYWTGMRNEITSVGLKHWCEKFGQPYSTFIEFRRKTRAEVVAAWNQRNGA